MTFKAKLRVIGNSQGVYIPKHVITGYEIGEVITLSVGEVITKDDVITDIRSGVITHPSQRETGRLVFNKGKGIYERK